MCEVCTEAVRMDMTPGLKHNDEHDEAQKKVFRGYGFRPGGTNKYTKSTMHLHVVTLRYRPRLHPPAHLTRTMHLHMTTSHKLQTISHPPNKKNISQHRQKQLPLTRKKKLWCQNRQPFHAIASYQKENVTLPHEIVFWKKIDALCRTKWAYDEKQTQIIVYTSIAWSVFQLTQIWLRSQTNTSCFMVAVWVCGAL